MDRAPASTLVPQGSKTLPERTEEWPFVSRSIDVAGNTIHYVDEGAGPVLLFVHLGFWVFVWRDVIRDLSSSFRCVALDFPGTGYSTPSPIHELTLPANIRVLEGFVDALQLRDLTLVAHDLGGPLAFGLARRHPESVKAFVIAQTFGWPLADYKWVARMCRLMSGPTLSWVNRNLNLIARMSAGRFGVGKHLSRTDRRTFLAPFDDRSVREAWSRLIGGPLEIDEELAKIDVALHTTLNDRPALGIFGARNDPYDWQGRYERTFESFRGVVVPKGLHFPFCDDPDLFAASLRSWWAQTLTSDE